jgi:TonB-linked SusC/RagA family outer membrane protein
MKRLKMLFAALFLMVSVAALAQNTKVKGSVTDATTGDPIPYATVQVKGTSIGTSTGLDGSYSLSVPPKTTLLFSFVGYKTAEVEVGDKTQIDVMLQPDAEYLDDVLVVAYGTAKKESFTGSASTIKSETLEKRTVANVTKALDGLAPGVQTTSGSGQPGAGASVIIRGFGSINASSSPLYVVDGVPYDGAINAINPNDIESMTVIKDASAGALYGARGANGVVIITTKKGGDGPANVNFKGTWGISSRAIPRYETLNTKQWMEDILYMYTNDYLIRDGLPLAEARKSAFDYITTGALKAFGSKGQYNPYDVPLDQVYDMSTGKVVESANLKWNDDWLDLSTNPAPLRQEYQMTISGGNQNNKYMFSVGYLNEEGLVTLSKFERISGRANVENQIRPWFRTGLNMNVARNTSNMTALGNTATSSTGYSNVFYSCMTMAPIYPLYLRNEDGSYALDANGEKQYDWGNDRPSGANTGWNPVANLIDDKYQYGSDNFSGRTFVELGNVKTGALAGLKFTVNLGVDVVNTKNRTYYNPYFGNAKSKNGLVEIEDGRTFSYTLNELLGYDRSFGLHHIDFLAGHEAYGYNYQYLMGYKSGFPFGNLYELAAASTLEDANSYTSDYRVESWLSRLNYDFADKYYFSASFRRDGSSRFYQDKRWGNFWSVGASWRISQEEFMKNIGWLNNLTLKASYGVQGNDSLEKIYAWQSFYSLSYSNGPFPGAVVTSLESKDITWEKNQNINVGIEARMFDRLSLTAEYYNRYTTDMLMNYPMAVSLGFDGYDMNIGNMTNSGFELSLTGEIIKNRNTRWAMTWMGSTVKNKVLHLANKPKIVSGNYVTQEGQTYGSFYLPESAGVDPATGNKLYWAWDAKIDETTGEVIKDKFGDPVPDGDKYITDDPQKAATCKSICGSRLPALYGSWSNEVRFGNFDFSLMTTYSIGGKINDGVYRSLLYHTYPGETGHVDRLKAWKQPGDVTSIPRIDQHGIYDIELTSDELFDASYFAIKNVTFGYTLPENVLKAISMKSVRVFFSADNIYMFTALKGMDPQYNFTGGTGFTYTPTRTISLGLDINF